MRAADHIVDFGPGPGVRGGHVVAAGPVAAVVAAAGERHRAVPFRRAADRDPAHAPPRQRPPPRRPRRAGTTTSRTSTWKFPLGAFVCVTGVSGSGKSSLVNDILAEALNRDLNAGLGNPGLHDGIDGADHLDRLIAIDQSPIGRTPRSNPATYVKVFDEIRKLYAMLPESKARGYAPGRFSFNVSGGRCEACEGNGSNKLEMDFLADVWVTCPVCEGHRFNRETLQVRFKGKSIAEVLEMDIQEALRHFENVTPIAQKLQTLHDVGLDYMKLGQPSPTLSGGEAQRVKLARELVKKSSGRALYLLDEPTTGLHFADIELLLKVLHGFVEAGNTVLVVEHNLEVVKTADWIIDLGPEGGDLGGRIVAAGTPEHVAACEASHTGRVLRGVLNGHPSPLIAAPAAAPARKVELAKFLKVRGARQHNLKGIDVDIPRDCITVLCGPSGSGKSSLAMDTIYAEGQRRYVESLSAYARQFIGQMQKPKLDHIEGLSPAIAIEQKHSGQTPRSTVGTVTEIYDYLRILLSRMGQPHCPACDVPVGQQSADEVIEKIMSHPAGTKLHLMAPLEIHVGERYETLWEHARAAGYVRIRVDGQTYSVDQPPEIDRRRKHQVEAVIDRVTVRPDARGRIAGSVENALALGRGVLDGGLSRATTCPSPPGTRASTASILRASDAGGVSSRSRRTISPSTVRLGWCPACEGLGVQTGTNPAALGPRSEAHAGRGRRRALAGPGIGRLFRAMLESLSPRDRPAAGRPLRAAWRQASAIGDARDRRAVVRGRGLSRRTPPSAFNTRACIRRWRRPAAFRPASAPGWNTSSTRSSVPSATAAGSATTRRPCGSAAARWTNSAAFPWASWLAEFAAWKPNATRAEDRRRVAPRDRQPAAIPRRRGTGLPDARPARPDALRRRDAADSPGRPGGQRAVRRALRARRADHRTASPRQPPPAGRPAEAPRPGQYAVGRRARPRGGVRGGSTAWISVPGRGDWAGRSSPKEPPPNCPPAADRSPVRISPARRRSLCR